MKKEMIKRIRLSLPLGTLVLLLVLSLLTGCFKPAAPDVADTPAGEPQDVQAEGTPDIMATAEANSTLAAAGGEEAPDAEETQATATPTSPPPTGTATPTPFATAASTHTPIPISPTPTPSPAGQVEHIVQPGENLFRIALRYGTTVGAIATTNGIANPGLIYVGQVLIISSSGSGDQPPTTGGTTYVVQPGDNLFRIALRYEMSYIYLAQYNNIANPANIYVGQVIRIP